MKVDLFPNKFLTERNKNPNKRKESNHPKISIVMPSYNQAQFIERSILSVINQDYANTELIIIDGGSKDGTVDIIQKYKDKITLWISEKDQGQSDALNKGFKHCTGEIFGWLNSDDIYLPNAFKFIIEAFEKNPDKNILHGDWLEIDSDDKIIFRNFSFKFNLNQFLYEGWGLHPQSLFWTKDVHLRFGQFDEDLHTNMDKQMILRFAENESIKNFKQIPFFLCAWRRHAAQKTENNLFQIQKDNALFNTRYKIKKYSFFLELVIKYIYKFRRAYFYFKRGGFFYFLLRFKKFFKF